MISLNAILFSSQEEGTPNAVDNTHFFVSSLGLIVLSTEHEREGEAITLSLRNSNFWFFKVRNCFFPVERNEGK